MLIIDMPKKYLTDASGFVSCAMCQKYLPLLYRDCHNDFKGCLIKGELPEKHGDLIDTSMVVGSIKRETDIHDVTLKEYLGFKFPVQQIVPIDEFLENRKTIPIIVAEERKDDGRDSD